MFIALSCTSLTLSLGSPSLTLIPGAPEGPQGHHFLRAHCCTGTGMRARVQLGLRWMAERAVLTEVWEQELDVLH